LAKETEEKRNRKIFLKDFAVQQTNRNN